MSNYYILGELTKARQNELRQEAQYAAQLRQMSSGSRPILIKSHWKRAAALGAAAVLIAVVVMLSNGAAI